MSDDFKQRMSLVFQETFYEELQAEKQKKLWQGFCALWPKIAKRELENWWNSFCSIWQAIATEYGNDIARATVNWNNFCGLWGEIGTVMRKIMPRQTTLVTKGTEVEKLKRRGWVLVEATPYGVKMAKD